jgi:FkbM family methyltransferase
MARWYFSHFPLERGKWRLWVRFLRFPGYREIPSGVRRLKYGIRMHLDPENFIELFTYYWSCWEPNETWVVRRLLRPGDVFVDIGANIGYFSLLGGRAVGDRGRVIAIEPTPPTVAKLEDNLKMNGLKNIKVHELAVLDRPGTVRIHQPHDDNIGANTLRPSGYSERYWDVSAATLDDLLIGEPRIRLVKLDLEGAELLALRGFIKHLSSPEGPLVLCEVTDRFLRELGGSARDLFSLMADYGYEAFSCENLTLRPVSANDIDGVDQMNCLFVKSASQPRTVAVRKRVRSVAD